MGGKRRKEEVRLTPYQQYITDISNMPKSINLTPFVQQVSSAFQRLEQEKVEKPLQQMQSERLANLRNALMNAIGSLSYNPYEREITGAIQSLRQKHIQNLEQSKSDIISQYQKITPDVATVLRAGGGYAFFPEAQTYYERAQSFLNSTRNMLSNIGLSEEEISQAMQPYVNLMEEGRKVAEKRVS